MAYLIIRTMSNWRGIRNRVPLVNFYLFTILSSFILYRGIFMLFLSGKGLTLAEVGLYQTFFFLANTALEIPTGYIGDRFGRKASIVSGLVILCIYSLLITLTLPVMLVVGLAVIEALAYSLISGSDSALLYDNVKELYGEKSFDRINSQIHSTRAIAVGFGIVAGSLISTASWNLLYYLSAAINLSSAFVALGIRDAHSVTRQKRLPIKLSDFGSYITHKNPTGFILSILGIALADGLFIVIFNYNQLTLKHSSVSTPIIGVIFATIYFLNPISYMVAGRLSSQTNKVRLIIWGLLIQACALSLFTLVQSWLLIGVVLLSSLVPEYIFINYENYVQQNIRSELRATLMSTVSMLRSVSAAFLYLVIGVVMDKADGRLVTSYCGAALFISVLIVVSILRWKNRNTRRAVQRISIDEIPLGEYSDDYISRIITQQLEDTLVPPQNGQPPSDRLSVVLADDGIVIQKGVSSLDETDLEYVFTQLVGRLQDKKYPRNIFALGISNYANYFRGEANFDDVGICFHDETIFIRVQQNFRRHVEVYLSGVRVAWKRSALSPIEIKRHPLFRTQIIVRKRNRLQQFILVRNVYVELALYWLGYLHVTSNTTFPESLKKLLVSRNAAKRELSCLSMFLVFNNRNSVTYDDRLLRRTISVNLALSLLGQRFKNTLSISDEKACDKSLPGTDGHERTLTLGYDAYYPNRAVARFIAEQLRPIGLKVRLVETNFVKPNWSNDMQLVILNEPSNRQCLNYFSLGYLSPLKKSPEQFKLFYELISQCIASDTDIDLKAGPLASLMHDQVPFIPIARLKNFYLLRPGFEDPYNGL